MVKNQKWSDAKEFYTKALAVLTDKSQETWKKGEDPESAAQKERELQEQCFTNRALCHLELSTNALLDLRKNALMKARELPGNDH